MLSNTRCRVFPWPTPLMRSLTTQQPSMFNTMRCSARGYLEGWLACGVVHAPINGTGHFDEDKWELYNLEEDWSQSNDVADKYRKTERAERVLDGRSESEQRAAAGRPCSRRNLGTPRPSDEPPRDTWYYPDTEPVPEGVAANVRGRSYKILANVDITDKSEGVIFAHGSRFGGHALFIKDKKLYYVYNFLGIAPEQVFESDVTLKPGKIHGGHGV